MNISVLKKILQQCNFDPKKDSTHKVLCQNMNKGYATTRIIEIASNPLSGVQQWLIGIWLFAYLINAKTGSQVKRQPRISTPEKIN